MTTTADIYSFRVRSLIVLVIASTISAYCFLWPFFLNAHSSAHHLNNQIFSLVGVPVALAVLIVEISDQRLDAKSVALLGVLAALAAALRPMGAGAVGIEPMWFLLILSARVFGPAFGLILGILAMFDYRWVRSVVGLPDVCCWLGRTWCRVASATFGKSPR
jgi:energy-coupling factor transport system substrate-specific component